MKNFSRDFYPRIPLSLIFGGLLCFVVYHPFLGWTYFVGTLGCFFVFDNLGVQLGVHKLLCHRSFRASPAVKRTLALFSIFTGQGSPLVWVAVHMGSHHPHYDTTDDVHSPLKGKFYAFLGWYWRVDKSKISFLAAREYLRDDVLKFFHQRHLEILLGYWCLLVGLGGWTALVFFGFLPAACSITLAGFVNCFMHSTPVMWDKVFWKYQNHADSSTFNSVWLGALTMGLGLHNNHHANPTQCFYDEKWYEIDPSRFVIPFLREPAEKKSQ